MQSAAASPPRRVSRYFEPVAADHDDTTAATPPTSAPLSHAATVAAVPPPVDGEAEVEEDAALRALRAQIPTLGAGWRVERRRRASGATAGHVDVYFVAPSGEKLRSRAAVARFVSAAQLPLATSPLPHRPHERRRLATEEPQREGSVQQEPAVASQPSEASPPASPASPAQPPRRRRAASGAAVPFFASTSRPPFTWVPPASPYGLLQEQLYADPWRVLVACALLNKTSCVAVRNVIWDLFARWPNAVAAAAPNQAERIAELIKPLGLTRRALLIAALSSAWVAGSWRKITDLPGVGRYAAEAYALFCTGEWEEVGGGARDKELRRYGCWLVATGGLGSGLTRDALPSGVVLQ